MGDFDLAGGLDFNNAEPQVVFGQLIEDGTFAQLCMTFRAGGVDGPGPGDRGLLKTSKQPGSDVVMLDAEFTVSAGPLFKRKFWQHLTVRGGKVDAKGESIGWNITRSTLRAMVESAMGIDPKDMSAEAKAKRAFSGFADLNGIVFAGKIMIEPSQSAAYGDSNKLERVVTPDDPRWAKIMAGEALPAEPSPRRERPAAPVVAWNQPAAARTNQGWQQAAAKALPDWVK